MTAGTGKAKTRRATATNRNKMRVSQQANRIACWGYAVSDKAAPGRETGADSSCEIKAKGGYQNRLPI